MVLVLHCLSADGEERMSGEPGTKLTRKDLQRLMRLYQPADRGRWLVRIDEVQHLIAGMTDDQFDDFVALARRFCHSQLCPD